MAEERDTTDDVGDDASVDRRSVLQATAATGILPAVGRTVGASPVGSDDGPVPDVTLSNLTDRRTSVTLEVVGGSGADGDDGFFGSHSSTQEVTLDGDADAEIGDLAASFGASGLQSMASNGTVELRIGVDGRGTETLAVGTDFSSSDEIANVVVFPDRTRVSLLHYDRPVPSTGGSA